MNSTVYFALLLVFTCQVYSAYTIELDSEPETFVPGVTPNLTLNCNPGRTINDTSNIVVFQLSKGGILLATGKPTGVILNENLRTSKYSATSEIDLNNLPNAYLLFAIQFPEAEDEGQYICHMNYEDKGGFFQTAETTLHLKRNATDDISLQNQLKQTQQLIENMRARVSSLESQVFDLALVNSNQTRTISDLTNMASSRIAFFATLEKQCSIATDDVVIFNHLVFNNGSGFNSTSGIFVTPRSGFYVLNVVCEVQSDVAIRMEMMLMVNSTIVTKLFIAGEVTSRGGQQSASMVYNLPAGSEVKVVVGSIQTESASQVELLSENLSYFSGYYLG